MIADDTHLQIGSLLFEGLDQIDLTGPFEVLSRIPNATYRIYGTTDATVRDVRGLRMTPDAIYTDAPQLDVLHVPGGFGQEALMEDEPVLSWLGHQAGNAKCVFSVCTGALICGAAGLLKGRRATTHWASCTRLAERHPLVRLEPDAIYVRDGSIWTSAGVTAGMDLALAMVEEDHGREIALVSNDFTVLGASSSVINMKKIKHVKQVANKRGLPLVLLGESSGARMPDRMGAAGRVLRWRGLSAAAVLHPDRRACGEQAGSRQGSAEPCRAVLVLSEVAAAAAVSVQRLATHVGGPGQPAPTAGAGAALRAVLAVAQLRRVFADQRQAAVLPVAGIRWYRPADGRRNCSIA